MSPARKPSSKATTGAARGGAKKPAAKKTPVKKAAARKTSTKKKATAKKTTARKVPAAKSKAVEGRARKATPRKTPLKKRPERPREKRVAPRPARPAKLDKKTLAAIRTQLTDEVEVLMRQGAELEEASFEGTQSDITGEVGLDEDFADAGTATFERERDLSIRNNIRDLIDQITRAIGRIDEGTYGTCERCGRPIDAARLKALPHALLCMECKRREERAR
jgi:RNA polymerase-binding protein DksA